MTKHIDSVSSSTQSGASFAPVVASPRLNPRRALATSSTTLSLIALTVGLLFANAVRADDGAQDKVANKEPLVLDKTVVNGVSRPDTALTADIAAVKLADIPGAFSLVTSADVEKGRVGSSADVLAFQPGIFAAPPGGSGDGIKLSIRGSAIARSAGNFFRAGTLFTFDGLPVTGAGGTPYELFETYGLNYTEVLLGGNAFDYGALQIGGAINYVTKTGYDASPFESRVEFGSFGYRKAQVSSGQVVDKADYFISVAESRIDGFQNNAQGKSLGFAGNFGYRFTPDVNTRFFLRYRTTENANPGTISLNELNTHPDRANPNNVTNNTYRTQPGSTWIGNRTDFKISPDSSAEIGFVFHDAPIDISPKPSQGNVGAPLADAERSIWNFRDVTVLGKYTRTDTLLGRPSTTTLAGSVDVEYDADVNVYANNSNVITGPRAFRSLLKTANYNGSQDNSARIINELKLSEKLALDSGVALVYIRRASEVTYVSPTLPPAAPAPGAAGGTVDRNNAYLAPRLGLHYDVNPNVTLFTNVTRSIEGPNSWQLNRGSQGNYQANDNIKDQKAIAFEVGSRVNVGVFTGSLSLYRTDVKDELLSIPIVPGDPSKGSYTFNGSDTYKQGVEFGLDTIVWSEKGFLTAPKVSDSKLVLSQSFSYNDFGYKNDPTFGKNQLPGVPREYYQVRLQYDHASGFYANVSVQYASRYYVDFRNQLQAPAYVLLGSTIGYESPKHHWQVYLDGRNLSNAKYASSAGPVFDAGPIATNRTNRLFYAGDGFGIFGGVTFKL